MDPPGPLAPGGDPRLVRIPFLYIVVSHFQVVGWNFDPRNVAGDQEHASATLGEIQEVIYLIPDILFAAKGQGSRNAQSGKK
jgi:hypothetical protein